MRNLSLREMVAMVAWPPRTGTGGRVHASPSQEAVGLHDLSAPTP